MRDDLGMRTTLLIDDDVLQAAKELAEAKGITAGKALSDLARIGLAPKRTATVRNGVPLLPRRPASAPKTTLKRVNELRDEG